MSLHCAVCKKPITPGPYRRYNGGVFHIECFNKSIAPRCHYCGEILSGEYTVHNKKNYHTHCFTAHVAPRCSLCNKPLTGRYIKNFWGDMYHQEHEKKASCLYCSRPISEGLTGGGISYEDGRKVCNLCVKEAVPTLKQAKNILEEARKELESFGIKIDNTPPLSLVNSRRLAEIGGKKKVDYNHQGFTKREIRYVNNRITDCKIEILILDRLPHSHFLSTAAHELMHVWLYLKGKSGLPEDIVEGSCNYASYLVLSKKQPLAGGYIIHTMQHSSSRLYGKGFRKIFKLVETKGIRFWLNSLIR